MPGCCYANENHHLLQDILHGEWGYDGAVVTDWGGSNDHVEGVREGSTLAGFCAGYERSGTPNPAFVEEAAALARKADVVVLCMGLDESSESEGLDRSHICIPENQKQLLEAVAQANENLVVVLSAGSVVETGWISRCKAVLHAYLGGQAGVGAIMDVLTGRVNPSGKLAETLPLTYEDTPAARRCKTI